MTLTVKPEYLRIQAGEASIVAWLYPVELERKPYVFLNILPLFGEGLPDTAVVFGPDWRPEELLKRTSPPEMLVVCGAPLLVCIQLSAWVRETLLDWGCTQRSDVAQA
jgi:hypothetical protein